MEGEEPHAQRLHREASALVAGFRQVRFEHVRRERNVEADRLANRGVDEWLAGEGASWERLHRLLACGRRRRRDHADQVLERELEAERVRPDTVDERQDAPVRRALRGEHHQAVDGLARRDDVERRGDHALDAFERVAAVDEQRGPVGIEHDVVGPEIPNDDVELPVRREHEQGIKTHADVTGRPLLVAEQLDAVGHRHAVAEQVLDLYVPADERIRVTGPSNTRTRSIGSSPNGSNRKSTEAERPTDARSARGVARAPMNSTSRTSAWDRIVPLNSRCCTSSHVTHEARSGPTTRSSRGPIPWSGDARYASTNSTTVCRAAEASSAGPGASCDGAIGAAGPTGSRAHAASASAVTTTRAARARMDAPMIRPGRVPILGAEEPAGRPRVATLEERPDSAGQGAG